MTPLFWTQKRILLASVTVILTVILGIAFTYLLLPDQSVLLTQGDFPSFYAAAKIMHDGMENQLYSGTLQRTIQNHYWPYITHYYIYFPYPPYFASLLSPLAALPPAAAKALWDSLMILCWFFSILIAGQTAPFLRKNPIATFAFMISFTPVLMGLLGSQNIALGMLLYAIVMWGFSLKKDWAEYLCGIALGLWLFKPHYPILLACFFLFAGYFRVLLGFLFVATIYYLMSAFAISWDWPAYWSIAVKWFSEENARMSPFKMVSILGFTRAFFATFGISAKLAEILGYGIPLFIFGGLSFQFWKAGRMSPPQKQNRMLDLIAAAGPALILLSPHTLFYDTGICLFSCARFLDLKSDRDINLLLLLQVFMILSVAARQTVPFQPIFFAVLGAFILIHKKLRIRAQTMLD